jgi:hypothetical protein
VKDIAQKARPSEKRNIIDLHLCLRNSAARAEL